MDLLIFAMVLGVIPGFIAQSKGRSFFPWWIYGTLIFIVALIHSIVMKDDDTVIEQNKLSEGTKKCPRCAETIKLEAKVCRYCSNEFTDYEIETLKDEKTALTKLKSKHGVHHWSDDDSTHNIESRCPTCGDFFHGSEYTECTKCNCKLVTI